MCAGLGAILKSCRAGGCVESVQSFVAISRVCSTECCIERCEVIFCYIESVQGRVRAIRQDKHRKAGSVQHSVIQHVGNVQCTMSSLE